MGWVKGIDVSHYQDPAATAKLCRAEGIRFAWVKVSQGRSFRDPKRYQHYHALRDAGVKVGAYHYFDFGRTARENADNMIAASSGVTWDLPHVLDCEDPNRPADKRQCATMILEALSVVERQTGRRPIVYTYASWWASSVEPSHQFATFPLWVARYPNVYLDGHVPADTATTNVPAPWATWTVWQYTDGRGRLDRNIMSPQAFATLTNGAVGDGGWQAPPFTGTIRAGQESDRVAALALMLKAAGYGGFKATGASARVYGIGKQLAVKRFKRRHNLAPVNAVVAQTTWGAVAAAAKRKIDAKAKPKP